METDGSSLNHVNLTDLGLRSSPQPLDELNLTQHYNRLGIVRPPGTGRLRVCGYDTPLSSRSSPFSTPIVSTNVLEYVDLTEPDESFGRAQAYHNLKSWDMGNRSDAVPRYNWLEVSQSRSGFE
jgi:hypothetical protein